MKRLYATLAFMLAWPIHAEPSIASVTGKFTNLSQVTLSGAGYGAHANFNGFSHSRAAFLAVAFKDVEDAILTSDRLSVGGEGDNWAVGADSPRRNSGFYAHRFYLDNRNAPLSHAQIAAETTGDYYVSTWVRMPDQDKNCGSKYFRLYYGSHTSVDNVYMVTGCTGGTFNDWHLRGFCESAGIPSPNTVYGSVLQYQNNTWHFLEMWFSNRNGEVSIWLDGSRQWTRRESCAGLALCKDEKWMDKSGYSPGGEKLGFGYEAQTQSVCNTNCPGNSVVGQYDFDDMYISYTRAHVLLCSGSTWANRGTCEIQPPTSWSDSSISFALNQGAFTTAETAYLYVVTSRGETEREDVNLAGRSITIGSEVLAGNVGTGETGDVPVVIGGKLFKRGFEIEQNLTEMGYKCPCAIPKNQ